MVLRLHLVQVDGRAPLTGYAEADRWLIGENAVYWPSSDLLHVIEEP